MKIVLFGIQGSGKSTQGTLLHKKLGLPYLSTGHIFRIMAKEHTPIGRHIKEIMNAGLLVPDDKTLEIVSKYLNRPEYRRGYILDGFPRTLRQTENFKNGVDQVIYLRVSDREALWRIAHRIDDDNREDETLVALRKRIQSYHKFTDPVLDHYREKNLLLEIDGEQSVEDIHHEILQNLILLHKDKKGFFIPPPPQKTVLAIVGMPGAGKTEAADYLRKKGIPFVRFGDLTDETMKKMGIPRTVENERIVRESLRQEYGMSAYAMKLEPRIKEFLKKNEVVGIDGMRSWEEFLLLKKEFKRMVVISIMAEPRIRYERLSKRIVRRIPVKLAEERDIAELEKLNMGGPIAIADYFIENNAESIEGLHEKLDAMLVHLHINLDD